MNKLVTEGHERYERELKESAELLDSLRRQLGIASETGDRRLLNQNLKSEIRPVTAPAIAPAEGSRVEEYLRVRQYLLEPGKTLIGIAEAKVNGSFLLRYVRGPAAKSGKDATVGVFTKEEAFNLSFSGLDDENVTLHDVSSFARLLGNYQNQVPEELPEKEVPELVDSSAPHLIEA